MVCSIQKFLVTTCLFGCFGCASAGGELYFRSIQPEVTATPVLMWEQMSAKQRASLWPLLSHEQRLFHWRYMNKQDRLEMRSNMTENERQAFKRRYVVDSVRLGTQQCPPVPSMSQEERSELRRQVMEVHIEIRRGIPYNCTDPTDCPKISGKFLGPDSHNVPVPDQENTAEQHDIMALQP